MPNSRLAGKGEDSDLCRLLIFMMSLLSRLTMCPLLGILVLQMLSLWQTILKIQLTRNAKILMSRHITMIDKCFLTQIKMHNHLRRKNERIKIACKDNASIKNTKDDLLNITCWNMHRLKEIWLK